MSNNKKEQPQAERESYVHTPEQKAYLNAANVIGKMQLMIMQHARDTIEIGYNLNTPSEWLHRDAGKDPSGLIITELQKSINKMQVKANDMVLQCMGLQRQLEVKEETGHE